MIRSIIHVSSPVVKVRSYVVRCEASQQTATPFTAPACVTARRVDLRPHTAPARPPAAAVLAWPHIDSGRSERPAGGYADDHWRQERQAAHGSAGCPERW